MRKHVVRDEGGELAQEVFGLEPRRSRVRPLQNASRSPLDICAYRPYSRMRKRPTTGKSRRYQHFLVVDLRRQFRCQAQLKRL